MLKEGVLGIILGDAAKHLQAQGIMAHVEGSGGEGGIGHDRQPSATGPHGSWARAVWIPRG